MQQQSQQRRLTYYKTGFVVEVGLWMHRRKKVSPHFQVSIQYFGSPKKQVPRKTGKISSF